MVTRGTRASRPWPPARRMRRAHGGCGKCLPGPFDACVSPFELPVVYYDMLARCSPRVRLAGGNDLDGEMALAVQGVGDQAREFGLFEQLLRAFDVGPLGHIELRVRVEPGEAHLAVDTIQGAFGARLEVGPRVFRRRG